MSFSKLQGFLSGDFKWIVILVAGFLLVPALKDQNYVKVISIIGISFVIIAFTGGANFMPVVSWVLGLVGIRI